MIATLERDSITGRCWLTFAAKPDAATIAALKAAGWRWGGYRKAWHHPSKFAQVPAGIAYEEVGTVDYAAERGTRLAKRAEKAQARADTAFGRAHALADMIPVGQPILVGHHSERRARRDADRIHASMSKGCAEQRTANHLAAAAESSERTQAARTESGALARRIARLERDLRAIRSWRKHSPQPEESDRRAAIVDREIAEAREALATAGGLAIDTVQITTGDIIRIKGWVVQVSRVNPKTISGTIIEGGAAGMSGKWDRSHFQEIIRPGRAS